MKFILLHFTLFTSLPREQPALKLEPFNCFSTKLVKEGLCVVECQAYAELNRWQEVIPFITQLYEGIEECPAKIVQLGYVISLISSILMDIKVMFY